MTIEVEKTGWSLPGPADIPVRQAEPPAGGLRGNASAAGLRGCLNLGQDRLRGRDSQRLHPAPGLLLGAAAPGRPLVEPGRDGADGGPLEDAPGLAGGPATRGV